MTNRATGLLAVNGGNGDKFPVRIGQKPPSANGRCAKRQCVQTGSFLRQPRPTPSNHSLQQPVEEVTLAPEAGQPWLQRHSALISIRSLAGGPARADGPNATHCRCTVEKRASQYRCWDRQKRGAPGQFRIREERAASPGSRAKPG